MQETESVKLLMLLFHPTCIVSLLSVSLGFVGRSVQPGYFAELALHSAMTLALCFVSNLTAVVLIVTVSVAQNCHGLEF